MGAPCIVQLNHSIKLNLINHNLWSESFEIISSFSILSHSLSLSPPPLLSQSTEFVIGDWWTIFGVLRKCTVRLAIWIMSVEWFRNENANDCDVIIVIFYWRCNGSSASSCWCSRNFAFFSASKQCFHYIPITVWFLSDVAKSDGFLVAATVNNRIHIPAVLWSNAQRAFTWELIDGNCFSFTDSSE